MNGHIVLKTFGGKKHYKPWNFVLGVEELDTAEGKLPPFHRNLRDDMAGNHLEYVSSPKSLFFFLEKDLGFFYGAKLDTVGVVDNDRSKIKAIGKRKSKEIGLVEELLDSTAEVDENNGRKMALSKKQSKKAKLAGGEIDEEADDQGSHEVYVSQ